MAGETCPTEKPTGEFVVQGGRQGVICNDWTDVKLEGLYWTLEFILGGGLGGCSKFDFFLGYSSLSVSESEEIRFEVMKRLKV